ncbi:conserved phage C-terminal domain-containing protein [Alteribacter keqinensis]|nr:conserved phage C-terminal domain-containing protein [Alteribacter keqinensis]
MRKLKRVVLREELLALTGDYKLAMVLNQMIYWSQYVQDFDKFIEEEASWNHEAIGQSLEGWIFKKAEELSEETLMNVSGNAMRRYLKSLITSGWLEERENPYQKWDHTRQYRVKLAKIQDDLVKIGYYLADYRIDMTTLGLSGDRQKGDSAVHNGDTARSSDGSNGHSDGTIPESTTEITTDKIPFVDIVDYLNEKTESKYKATTRKTKELIKARWTEGHRLEDFKTVIDHKSEEWLMDPKMSMFLRPTTLFGTNFEAYLNRKAQPAHRDYEFEKLLKELE